MIDHVLKKLSQNNRKRRGDVSRKDSRIADHHELDRSFRRDKTFFDHSNQWSNNFDERHIVTNRDRQRLVHKSD